MDKKRVIGLSAGVLATSALLYGVSQYVVPNQSVKEAAPQDDFYQFVNASWLEKTTIPSDLPAYSVANELTDDIDERMRKDVKDLVSGKEKSDLAGMDEFITLYKVATDFKKREQDGTEPIEKYLKEIEKVNSLSELADLTAKWTLDRLPQPFSISVGPNPQKTDEKMITLSSPVSILPDVSYYKDEATKKQYLGLYEKTSVAVLKEMGYSDKEAEKLTKQAIAFDASIVPYLLSAEEASDVDNTVNIKSAEEVAAYSKTIPFIEAIKQLTGQDVTAVNVATVKYYENIDRILTDDNFENLKGWLLVQEAMGDSAYLNDAAREAGSQYEMALMGVKELPDKTDSARNLAVDTFSPVFSVYYGNKYFGKEAKQDVTEMINNIVAVYKKRLQANDWLSEETKSKAVEKLDKIRTYVGFPEEVPEEIQMLDFDTSKSLLDNIYDSQRLAVRYSFEHFNEPIDKTLWNAPSYQVNAFYGPTNNSITFPAAILQAPFYSADQSKAANYGAIGAVIGHEITHAFDNNGALFDAQGNMTNWWTEADFKAFDAKTKAMIKHFDGLEVTGGKVDGQLTVSENIADAGGLSASLEALKGIDKEADLTAFFENYAKIWRMKSTDAFAQYALLDVHAPAEWRVNRQVNLLPEFYEVYEVKSGDGMYLPEKDRVAIW